jgi:diguanylate cyclase (GGDEF)-like protein
MEGLLENMNCNIIKASSGNQALSLILEYDFALVLLDVQMPEMDGFETAELMRGSEKSRHIPIIFITAISKDQRCIFKGYELGAVDYLFKPIEPVILKSKVSIFIELYQQKLQLKEQAKQLESKIEELLMLREANGRLESLSTIDGLTQIPNRRDFDIHIKANWKNSMRESTPISVIMIDIDNFKAYNDNYGHLQGDECLKRVAKCLSYSLLRPFDYAARYGGEEFVVVLPNTDGEAAMKVGEAIRTNIEDLNIPHSYSKTSPYVTVSLGVSSTTPEVQDSLVEFIDNADKALYQSKDHGRNRISLFSEK